MVFLAAGELSGVVLKRATEVLKTGLNIAVCALQC